MHEDLSRGQAKGKRPVRYFRFQLSRGQATGKGPVRYFSFQLSGLVDNQLCKFLKNNQFSALRQEDIIIFA